MFTLTRSKLNVEKTVIGFKRSELINIEAATLKDAFFILGKKNSLEIKKSLRKELKNLNPRRKKQVFGELKKNLVKLNKLAKGKELKVKGVNRLSRFLEAFYATCEGAGISYLEGALLQSESEYGCQTVIVQNKKDRTIRLIHTEEDSDFSRSKSKFYHYRFVNMNISGQKISYFLYPDIFGWGYAIGINETAGLVQVVDDLIPLPEYNLGPLWSSAITFMTLDLGGKKEVVELLHKIQKIAARVKFNGGYALHLCWSGKRPEFKSYEFAYNKVRSSTPFETADRLFLGQTNASLIDDIRPFTYSSIPPKGKKWNLTAAQFYVEMKERGKRLIHLAAGSDWLNKKPHEAINKGLEILATPNVDVGRYRGKNKKFKYYITGLPSPWTLAHLAVHLGKNHLVYYLGKFTPKPLPGKKYSIRYREDYPFLGKKLWEEARKEYQAFHARRKH